MIICTQCGEGNPDGTNFCTTCGAFLEWKGQAVPTTEIPAVRSRSGPRAGVITSLSPTHVSVAPGSEVGCEVTVRNRGEIVDQFSLEVVGEPAAWASLEPAAVNLLPGDEAVARLAFAPPHAADVAGGPRPFAVRVTSSVDPSCVEVQEGVIDIASFFGLSGGIVPQSTEARLASRHNVTIYNGGNTPLGAALRGEDPDDALRIRVSPSVVTLAAGAQAAARVRVRLRKASWIGQPQRRSFRIVTQSEQAEPVQLDASVVFKPLFGGLRRGHLIIARILLTLLGAAAVLQGAFLDWVPGRAGMSWTYPQFVGEVFGSRVRAPAGVPTGATAVGLVAIAFAFLLALGIITRTGGLTRLFSALALLTSVPFFLVTSSRLGAPLGPGATSIIAGAAVGLAGGLIGYAARR